MTGLLEGKVALITGGARGQGRAHAVASARAGADVILVDLLGQIRNVPYPMATEDDMAETVSLVEEEGRRAVAIRGDVRSQEQLNAAVARGIAEFGKIDILIANAGIFNRGLFFQLTDEVWDDMLAVNLTGVWKSAKAVAPHMIERLSGSIVITTSVNGIEPGATYAHYTAAKHGLIGLMKTIALELGRYNVRCNAVAPGAIHTPMTNHQGAWDMFAGHPGGTEADMLEGGYRFGILRGRTFLTGDAIADTVLYLNSDLAANVTGVTIPVESGHLLMGGVNSDPVRPAADRSDPEDA